MIKKLFIFVFLVCLFLLPDAVRADREVNNNFDLETLDLAGMPNNWSFFTSAPMGAFSVSTSTGYNSSISFLSVATTTVSSTMGATSFQSCFVLPSIIPSESSPYYQGELYNNFWDINSQDSSGCTDEVCSGVGNVLITCDLNITACSEGSGQNTYIYNWAIADWDYFSEGFPGVAALVGMEDETHTYVTGYSADYPNWNTHQTNHWFARSKPYVCSLWVTALMASDELKLDNMTVWAYETTTPSVSTSAISAPLFDFFWDHYYQPLWEIGGVGLLFALILGIVKVMKEWHNWFSKRF